MLSKLEWEKFEIYRLVLNENQSGKAFRQAYYHQARRGRVPKAKVRVKKNVVTVIVEMKDAPS